MSTLATLPPTLADLRRALLHGEFTCAEALAAQREARDTLDGTLNAIVERWDDGQPSLDPAAHPLAGAALLHKDIFCVDGRAPGCGLPHRRETRQQELAAHCRTAPVLNALAEAGAVHVGALAMAQYACGSTAENPALPRPLNPLDADAMVGGSSSGSAVAVAGGLSYASLGTDTAGSVRMPAASCGLVGLKPTTGLLPLAGVAPLAPSLDTVGVIARDAADAALVLQAASSSVAPCALDRVLADRPLPRVATVIDDASLDAEVGHALHAFAQQMAAHGFTLRTSRGAARRDDYARRAQIVLHTEAARSHRMRLQQRADAPLPAPMSAVLLPGVALPDSWYRDALDTRAAALDEALDGKTGLFACADLLLTPAFGIALPDWDVVHTGTPHFVPRTLGSLHRQFAWINYLGLPAVVFPIGVDRRQRPIAAQLVARPYAELTLLAVLQRLERDGLAFTHQALRRARCTPHSVIQSCEDVSCPESPLPAHSRASGFSISRACAPVRRACACSPTSAPTSSASSRRPASIQTRRCSPPIV